MGTDSRQQAQLQTLEAQAHLRRRQWLLILAIATAGFWSSVVFASTWLTSLFAAIAFLTMGMLLIQAARHRRMSKILSSSSESKIPELHRRKTDKYIYINRLRA